jgi:hypothetical protein
LPYVLSIISREVPLRRAPIHGKGKVVQGEGHGHIYVDGEEAPTLMIVGPWTYLPLDPGMHMLRVALNANDHNPWLWKGKAVEVMAGVRVAEAMG